MKAKYRTNGIPIITPQIGPTLLAFTGNGNERWDETNNNN
jgi:hypothetical protein